MVSKYRCFALARRHGFGLQLKKEAIASVFVGGNVLHLVVRFLGDLGSLLRNTKFNAETAEPAEKNPLKLCDLCVLCVQTL